MNGIENPESKPIDDIINKLEKINYSYLPLSHNKNKSINDHFDQFLDVFIKELNDDSVGCIVPVFFELIDWHEWKLVSYEYLKCFLAITSLNEILTYQNKLGDRFCKHFSKTIINDIKSDRKNILIDLDASVTELIHKPVGNSIHRFLFPKTTHNVITQKHNLEYKSVKEFNISSIEQVDFKENIVEEIYSNLISLVTKAEEKYRSEQFVYEIIRPVITHSLYISQEYSLLYVFSHTVCNIKKGFTSFDGGLGGVFILIKKALVEKDEDLIRITKQLEIISDKLSMRIVNYYQLFEIYKKQLKTAIVSILIDSFSHNISAHSLAALKWWIELRHKMLDKRFSVPVKQNEQGLFPDLYSPKLEAITLDMTNDSTKKYYEALGLTDSSYDGGFYSLYDFIQFAKPSTTCELFSFTEKVELLNKDKRTTISFNPRFPVPIDYALFPFFRFLRDKGAFWSGVTRDVANGGETKTWYKILWEDFANNPLYLGTIAKSEGITKININLAIESNGTFHHGRFVTIDMSVIDYEEKLIASTNLELEKNERNELLEIKHKEETYCKEEKCVCEKEIHNLKSEVRCHHSNKADTYVEPDSYSKYAFVRLGKCFAHFRAILDNEEFNVFLPGGIVGEHALFTIFENTIRNIKHYKKEINNFANDGIDFWISIEKANLKIAKDSNSLYKVAVWLGNETDLGNKKEKEDKFNLDDVLIKKVTDSTLLSILDDNGAPRMGGNSQDKACAAMLFNNEFKSVERIDNEKEAHYYPWITFSTSFKEKPFNNYYLDNGENEPYVRLNDAGKKNDYVKEYLNQIGINEEVKQKSGLLKKHFYLWQGADYLEVTDIKQLEGENISRFKFVVVNVSDDNKKRKEEILIRLRKDGVIRILEANIDGDQGRRVEIKKRVEDEYKDNDSKEKSDIVNKETSRRILKYLYSEWLKKWFNFESPLNLCLTETEGKSHKAYFEINPTCVNYHGCLKSPKGENEILPLTHGGEHELNCCNVRSHGHFWGKFFEFIKEKDVAKLRCVYAADQKLLYEFVEIILSQIVIFDKRLFNRFNKLPKVKQNIFSANLKLWVFDEELIDLSDDKKVAYDETQNLINKKVDEKFPLILIMHLSFIESLGFSEENMHQFIEKHLKGLFDKLGDRFLFIVTTGRGRDSWRTNLEKNDKEFKYVKKSLFKPVESLLNAVESGISYKDDFDVKYNLIKVIFGS